MVKQALRLASRTGAFANFVSLLERFDRGRDNLLHVLTYHRIDEPQNRPDLSPATLSATPAAFEQQMLFLSQRFDVVEMGQVLAAWRGESRLPRRAVLLTFDDAYQDFAEHAWPTLKQFGLPATLFVATAYPDQPHETFWWDRLFASLEAAPQDTRCVGPWGSLALDSPASKRAAHARLIDWLKLQPHAEVIECVERIARQFPAPAIPSPVLSWNELRQLAREGVTLGAHTRTHPLLSRVSTREAAEEIAGSLADLLREIGDVPPIFAYPGGKFNEAAVGAAADAGIELAFAGRRGSNAVERSDPLRLRRNHIGLATNPAVFRARLLSWSRFLNPWRPVTGR